MLDKNTETKAYKGNIIAMASNLKAMASNLVAMPAQNLVPVTAVHSFSGLRDILRPAVHSVGEPLPDRISEFSSSAEQ